MMRVRGGIKEATIEATVNRADGRVENLGVISYWHRSWFVRLIYKIRSRLYGISRH